MPKKQSLYIALYKHEAVGNTVSPLKKHTPLSLNGSSFHCDVVAQ